MFDGKTFLPVTGMPMRKIACMSRLFALADPVPLTVPILNAKSFTRAPLEGCGISALPPNGHAVAVPRMEPTTRTGSCPTRPSDNAQRTDHSAGRRLHL